MASRESLRWPRTWSDFKFAEVKIAGSARFRPRKMVLKLMAPNVDWLRLNTFSSSISAYGSMSVGAAPLSSASPFFKANRVFSAASARWLRAILR